MIYNVLNNKIAMKPIHVNNIFRILSEILCALSTCMSYDVVTLVKMGGRGWQSNKKAGNICKETSNSRIVKKGGGGIVHDVLIDHYKCNLQKII